MGRKSGIAYHQTKTKRVDKICMSCKRKYKAVSALSVVTDKPEYGICSKCKQSDENHYGEADWFGEQDIRI